MNHSSNTRKEKILSSGLLLIAAIVWGVAFVAQSAGMDYVGPCTFTFSRFLIGGLVLIPVIIMVEVRNTGDDSENSQKAADFSEAIKGGIVCGISLSVASLFQQYGLLYTSVAKSGFITTLYIIIVPILGLFFKKIPTWQVWISTFLALIGFYLLCDLQNVSLEKGDALELLCAFFFSVQILLVGYYSCKTNKPVTISCIQFFTASVVGGIGMLLFEDPKFSDILSAAVPILYAGFLSSGVGFTLQAVGQRKTDPTVASLIMSLEAVVAALAGWILLQETLTVQEIGGCMLVFFAIILAQIPFKNTPE